MAVNRRVAVRVLCAVVGVGLLTLGIIGLAQTGLSGLESTPEGVAPQTDAFLGGSGLMNLVHIGLGALALLAALRGGARLAGLFGILAFLGLLAYDVVALIADDPDDPLGSRWLAPVVHGLCLAASVVVVAVDESTDAKRYSKND